VGGAPVLCKAGEAVVALHAHAPNVKVGVIEEKFLYMIDFERTIAMEL